MSCPIVLTVIGVPSPQGSKVRVGNIMLDGTSTTGRAKLAEWRTKQYNVDGTPGCTITIESLADSEAKIREVRKTSAALARRRAKTGAA